MREDSPYLIVARARGVPIDTEMNLFMRLCRGTVIGVTGSNGKTTTTSLIGRSCGRRTHARRWGGISVARSSLRWEPSSRATLWCWSYPVFSSRTSPRSDVAHISASSSTSLPITSIGTAPWRPIWRRRGKFLPIKDLRMSPSSMPMIRGCGRSSAAAQSGALVQRCAAVEDGAYIEGDRVVVAHSGMASEVCRPGDIPLLGRHNVANVLAAVAAADAWGVPAAAMRAAIRAFPGVEHRLERVRELHGVSFYNDSIATSPTGTLAALAAIQQPIWLIAGGYDKGLPFEALGEAIVQRVKGVFLIGTTAPKIAQAITQARPPGRDLPAIHLCADLREAVLAAFGPRALERWCCCHPPAPATISFATSSSVVASSSSSCALRYLTLPGGQIVIPCTATDVRPKAACNRCDCSV